MAGTMDVCDGCMLSGEDISEKRIVIVQRFKHCQAGGKFCSQKCVAEFEAMLQDREDEAIEKARLKKNMATAAAAKVVVPVPVLRREVPLKPLCVSSSEEDIVNVPQAVKDQLLQCLTGYMDLAADESCSFAHDIVRDSQLRFLYRQLTVVLTHADWLLDPDRAMADWEEAMSRFDDVLVDTHKEIRANKNANLLAARRKRDLAARLASNSKGTKRAKASE